jgi:glycosyltransferase involved in cell wall biosynthesis
MKPLILFVAPVQSRSGYGEHSRDILRSLIKINKYDITVLPLRWGSTPLNALKAGIDDDILSRLLTSPQLPRKPEISIQLTVPNEFQPFAEFNIGITAGIETNICSAAWLEGLNRMNFNIVPSTFVKKVFENSVYTQNDPNTGQPVAQLKSQKPIFVLFEGTNTSIYKKEKSIPTSVRFELNKIPEDFLFLFVGHWLQGSLGQDRKDVGMLIKTFLETFRNRKNKPALLLKVGNTFSHLDRLDTLEKINTIKRSISGDLPNIYIIFGDLTAEEMNGLYNHSKVKVHISFTKGEGFGRPLLEASLTEKPVMASGWSGHVDFLPPDLALLLPGEVKQVHPSAVWNGVIEHNSKWFTVNYSFASNAMIDLYKRYEVYLPNAIALANKNRINFSFDKMTEELDKILTENLPKLTVNADIKLPALPKLKKINNIEDTKVETVKENIEISNEIKEQPAGSDITTGSNQPGSV